MPIGLQGFTVTQYLFTSELGYRNLLVGPWFCGSYQILRLVRLFYELLDLGFSDEERMNSHYWILCTITDVILRARLGTWNLEI